MSAPQTDREPKSSATPDIGSDEALVRQAAGGDEAAFESLYGRHSGRIYALCLRMSGDPGRAGELTHDAFVRAWERLSSFRGESSFGTWLHRLTVNVVLGASRTDRRREARVEPVDNLESAAELPEALAMTDPGQRVDLERAIAALPENARRVFVLHAVEGYPHDEIAALMQLAPGTVRAHLHRARHLLMTWLDR